MHKTYMRLGGLFLVAAVVGCSGDEPLPVMVNKPHLQAVANPGGIGYFVDGNGREVLLRGVNLNSFAEYWAFDPALPTVRPFTEADADFLASMGYNFVRFLITWSRVEPQPGQYDDAYLADVATAMQQLWARGIYVMVDMHQDGWGPHIAARAGEVCGDDEIPAGGWDGAPLWATLVSDATPRCLANTNGYYVREFNPAAQEAWANFLIHNAEGPGGVGLQERFAAMWGHVAAAMADVDGVMGYDVLNEPNTFSHEDHEGLAVIYSKTLATIRSAESGAGIEPRVFVFEPSAAWANQPAGGTVAKFTDDPQVAYGPHVYQGSIGLMPLNDGQLERLESEVADYGGVPVLVGEWGDWPADISDTEGYFLRMIQLQDEKGWSMAHWNYTSGCGDPHRYYDAYAAELAGEPWTYQSRDCANYESSQWYLETYAPLKRPALHYAPGRIVALSWDPAAQVFQAAGDAAQAGNELVLVLPDSFAALRVNVEGLQSLSHSEQAGTLVYRALARGGDWTLRAAP